MNSKPLLDYISQHVKLSPEEEATLLSLVQHRKYLKGQYVVQQGDICQHQCFVVSGCLKTFHMDPKGQEHIVMFSIENWWAGDMGSFITQTPADFNIQCIETTEMILFPFAKTEQLYQHIPKLERLFRLIIQNAYISTQKRIVQNFSMTAKERYLEFREKYPEIEQRVPQYMIASYLGITKEFLSKIRNKLLSE